MENLKASSNEFLLERSLSDTHKVNQQWASKIELWKLELTFFQKLLDIYGPNCENIDQKKEMDHFQNLLIYYSGELLDQYNQKVRRHEKLLKIIVSDPKTNEEPSYRNEHIELENEINAFIKEFINYKKEFYSFMEKLMYW